MRIRTTVALATLVSTAVLGGAAPASAATAADSTCTFTRTLCLWEGTNYSGARFTVSALNPSTGTCVDLAAHGWPNGRAHSGKNTGTQAARLYTTTNCTGSYYQIIPQGGYSSINFASNSVYVY